MTSALTNSNSHIEIYCAISNFRLIKPFRTQTVMIPVIHVVIITFQLELWLTVKTGCNTILFIFTFLSYDFYYLTN